ncbi:hypothetical protein LP417_35040 (plasmid) [Polaromonas sp. P1-6]|nr:hypothetical protein LP417_35040 [Polaromonas sp. P1-6]
MMKKFSVGVTRQGSFGALVVVAAASDAKARETALLSSQDQSILYTAIEGSTDAMVNFVRPADDDAVLTPVFDRESEEVATNEESAKRTDLIIACREKLMASCLGGANEDLIRSKWLLTSVLADILHWCDLHDIDFDDALKHSQLHFANEQALEESGK